MKHIPLPYSPARIKSMFTFNEADGRLYWKAKVLNHFPRRNHETLIAGHQRPATVKRPNPTVWLHLNRRNYAALRVAYVFHFGEDPQGVRFVPIDGDPTNLRADNIKLVAYQRSQLPEGIYEHYAKSIKQTYYKADVTVDGVRHVKKFYDLKEAVAWREALRLTAAKCAKWYAK